MTCQRSCQYFMFIHDVCCSFAYDIQVGERLSRHIWSLNYVELFQKLWTDQCVEDMFREDSSLDQNLRQNLTASLNVSCALPGYRSISNVFI